VPAGFNSDDEYVSEDDEKDNNIAVPTHTFRGLQPPPSSQDNSVQVAAKDTSKSSCPTAFAWTRNSCALRAPGTDPIKLRKEFITTSESSNVMGLNAGKVSGMENPAASSEYCTEQNSSDNGAPFGVPRTLHAKAQTDTTDYAWVEQVLKIKSRESTAPRGALEVRTRCCDSYDKHQFI